MLVIKSAFLFGVLFLMLERILTLLFRIVFVFFFIFKTGMLFDVRDLTNIQWCRKNYVRCEGCRSVVGFYYDGVVDLFQFTILRKVNAFTGRRSICEHSDCENPECPQYLLRAGVRQYNQRYGEDTLRLSGTGLCVVHTTLSVEDGTAAANTNLQWVPTRARFIDRVRLCVEKIALNTVLEADYANGNYVCVFCYYF